MSSENKSQLKQTPRPISVSQIITGHELRLRQIEQYMKSQVGNITSSDKPSNNSSANINSNQQLVVQEMNQKQQRAFQEMNQKQQRAFQEMNQKQHNLTNKMEGIIRDQSNFATQMSSYKEHINKLNELYVLFHREFLSFKEFVEDAKKIEMIITEKDADAEDAEDDADEDADDAEDEDEDADAEDADAEDAEDADDEDAEDEDEDADEN